MNPAHPLLVMLWSLCGALLSPSSVATAASNAGTVELLPSDVQWSYSLLVGGTKNRWVEHLALQNRRVIETATLPTAELWVHRETASTYSALRVLGLLGVRDYDGWSSIGQKILSTSDVVRSSVRATQLWKLSRGYSLGLGVENHYLQRQINGTESAQGYTEYFARNTLLVGGQKTWSHGYGDVVRLAGWIGWGDGGRMRLQVPSFDRSELRLGDEHLLEASLTWVSSRQMSENSSYRFLASLGHAISWRGESAGRMLTRNGLDVGVISQPKTVERDWSLMVGITQTW